MGVLTFVGLVAELEFKSDTSFRFAVIERHDQHSASMCGWIDIHYPCSGNHALHICACLNPDIACFASHYNYSGKPSKHTHQILEQLVKEVQAFLGISSAVTWHVDLQARSFGTSAEDPLTYLCGDFGAE